MSTIPELQPGDEVTNALSSATLIAVVAHHPVYPRLAMVVWWLPRPASRYSFDAMHPQQDVGNLMPSTDEDRDRRLREALSLPALT